MLERGGRGLAPRPRPPAPLPRAAPAAEVQFGPGGGGVARTHGSRGRGGGGPQVARHFSGGAQGREAAQEAEAAVPRTPSSKWSAGGQEAERRPSPPAVSRPMVGGGDRMRIQGWRRRFRGSGCGPQCGPAGDPGRTRV